MPIPDNLKSWRDVIAPHPDVAQGLYRQAEFALNLADIVRNRGRAEYTDPTEFFARTYMTDGLKKLLVETLKRLTSGDGEPVIQLKTSFGGGKSHSLLALYHLFGGKVNPSSVREVLDAAQVEKIPQVHTAVIVGTWENPLRSTLWGELAAQLVRSTGKPEIYEMIRENDERGVSPGVALLQEMFTKAGACLVLIDELVAYGRKLSIGEIEDGGTLGNLLTFIQELTEAVKTCPKAAVVVSIPESDAEVVDDLGQRVLRQVEHYFGRMELVWSPVSPAEGYEIVRRRLFKDCADPQARERTCAAFFQMYLNNAADFPGDVRQNNYREKLLQCYPIHPQLFKYLYEKWTSLENFQKTRGVLRLMAKVIYELWTSNDNSLLIMPGNIPLDAPSVCDEVTKLLGSNWDAIVNAEVDGRESKPRELDAQNSRFGRLAAARKTARSIFMGTAPGNRRGDVRGVSEEEIRLGVIQPQDFEHIADYNDALTKLKTNLYYLYSEGSRLWFGVNPTLRKLVDDKREKFSNDDVEFAIEQRLSRWKGRGQFKAVHICPKSSADVPDEQTARLVILSPKYAFIDGQKSNGATNAAKDILDNRGTVPRRWRNMLLFMAADAENLHTLKDVVRNFLAWQAVTEEARRLNLDTLQLEDATNNLQAAEKDFIMKTSQAYCRIFVPKRADDGDLNHPMHAEKIDCTKEENISAASDKFVHEGILILSLGGEWLLRVLDKFIWRDRDSLKVGQLWEYFAEYCYMYRLTDVNVLLGAVRKGVEQKIFAVAEDFRDGKYSELQFGAMNAQVSLSSLIVKAHVAQEQLNLKSPPPEPTPTVDDNGKEDSPSPTEDKPKPLPTHFSMDVELDKTRLTKNFNNCIEEVASNLMNLPNSKVSIRLVVDISAPEGIPAELKEVVTENCQALKIENFYFEN